jgi:hypothetical protein
MLRMLVIPLKKELSKGGYLGGKEGDKTDINRFDLSLQRLFISRLEN